MDLSELLAYSLSELGRGGVDRKHPFRLTTLSTVDRSGTPDMRMVVMRKFDQSTLQLRIYTDRRSNKVLQLAQQPLATLLFWNPRKRLQVKLKVHFEELPQEEAAQLYKQLPEQGVSSYNTSLAPGQVVPSPTDAWQQQTPPNDRHFLVLTATILELEALQLKNQDHLRAKYTFEEGKLQQSEWLVP